MIIKFKKEAMKYYTYSAILGKFKDDKILTDVEINKLNVHHLETGTLDGIEIQLSDSRAKKVWGLLESNFSEFLKEFGFKSQ